MKKILFPLFSLFVFLLGSCGSKTNQYNTVSENETVSENKTLVAFFSAQGHTKKVADSIASITGGTLFEIIPEVLYSEEDLDGWNDSSRGTLESKDRTTRPKVKSHVENMERYDTIFLGFPIWWYTAPTIVNTFLEQYDTSGKVIIPFATSGGSEYDETEKDLMVSAPKAVFKPGKVLNEMNKQQIQEWINTFKENE